MIVQSSELSQLKKACMLSTQILRQLYEAVKPGVSAKDLDDLAVKLCKQNNVVPAFYGVPGPDGKFPGNLCVSVNEEVLHTIPKSSRVFKEGDLVKVDFGIIMDGFYTDHCVTVGLGELSRQATQLLNIGKLAVESAISKAKPGNTTGDLGHSMQSIVEMAGFNVLKQYVGHGVGRSLHEHPNIPAYGTPGSGDKLEEGMVICVEAQVVAGSDDVEVLDDGWTVVTEDGQKAVMFEYMVVVGETPEILTDTREWETLA